MTARREVVITGIGVVSCLGNAAAGFWQGLRQGRSGIGPVTRFDASRFNCRLAGEIDDSGIGFDDGPFSYEIKKMSAFVRYALYAASRALEDSALAVEGSLPGRGRVCMGVAMGGLPSIEAGVMRQEAQGPRRTNPFLIPSLIPNMAASMIALRHSITAPQYTIAGACASGSQAMGEALRAIRDGECDWALCGGAEAVTTPITFSGFEAMRALSVESDVARTPKPFDMRRDGMVVGEGAAVFVLEARERAEARGAPIHAELSGYATNSSCIDITGVSVEDAADCMRAAVSDAGLAISDLDCVFAQSSGMVKGDASELGALHAIFGQSENRPAITSIKGNTGYLFAANGPLNVAAAMLALREDTVPPTLNFEVAPETFRYLDIVTAPRPLPARHCLVNAFGFGGINASLVVSRASASV